MGVGVGAGVGVAVGAGVGVGVAVGVAVGVGVGVGVGVAVGVAVGVGVGVGVGVAVGVGVDVGVGVGVGSRSCWQFSSLKPTKKMSDQPEIGSYPPSGPFVMRTLTRTKASPKKNRWTFCTSKVIRSDDSQFIS